MLPSSVGRIEVAMAISITGCGRLAFEAMETEITDARTSDATDPFAQFADLAAWYSMENDPSADFLVHANDPARDGSCLAPTCPSSVEGFIGKGLAFDGSSVVVIPASNMIGTAPFTVSVWAFFGGQPGNPAILIGKALGPNTNRNVYALAFDTGAMNYESSDGTEIRDLTVPGFDPRDAWHHYATVWDGVNKRIFVDGSEKASVAATLAAATEPVLLGQDFDLGAYDNEFVGTLDELRVYARALDSTEITLLADQR